MHHKSLKWWSTKHFNTINMANPFFRNFVIRIRMQWNFNFDQLNWNMIPDIRNDNGLDLKLYSVDINRVLWDQCHNAYAPIMLMCIWIHFCIATECGCYWIWKNIKKHIKILNKIIFQICEKNNEYVWRIGFVHSYNFELLKFFWFDFHFDKGLWFLCVPIVTFS